MKVVGELRTACKVKIDVSRGEGALGSRRIEGRRGRDENPGPASPQEVSPGSTGSRYYSRTIIPR